MASDDGVTITRRAVRTVDCGHCGTRYRYLAEVTATGRAGLTPGRGRAARKALERAETLARRLLEAAADPVPCPTCGRFQADMLPVVRRAQYRWMRWLPVGLWAAAPLLFFPPAFVASIALAHDVLGLDVNGEAATTLTFGSSLAAAAAPGFAARWLWRTRQRRFDPNRDIPEAERLALARNRPTRIVPPDETPT